MPTNPVTFGVEEEFLLLHPVSGWAQPAAPALLRLLHGQPGMTAELMRYQFETVTPVCTSTGQLRRELTRLRTVAAEGARSLGCDLIASGTAPFGAHGLSALSSDPRYQALASAQPTLTAFSGVCGCHVHGGVPSRDLGAQVLGRLRPWLATLLAISANSPIAGARDTGWASHRYQLVSLWPTARPPGIWHDATEYDDVVRHLVQRDAAMDERSVYFLARLSPRCPTVEVRVADTCPDTATTVVVAALVRALVVTAVKDIRAGVAPPPIPVSVVSAALLAAAENGLCGPGIDPFTGRVVPAWDLLTTLLDRIGKALADLGDTAVVGESLARLRARGTGADRQRRLWARTTSPPEFVGGLTTMTGAVE
jgi:carboxylate-amine ligase